MEKVIISAKGAKRVEGGHPWVFASDIARAPQVEPGSIVMVEREDGHFMGQGYYNAHSQISLRMLTRTKETIDREFLRERLRRAIEYRRALGWLDACRLVHGESDYLPALIVDKFADVLVVQVLSAGMERLRDDIVQCLAQLLPGLRCIYQRSDAPVRQKEGLEPATGVLYGSMPEQVEIVENGVRLLIDIAGGQKTGYFLDQRENRAAIAPFVKGARVLDCFCHIGSFSLHAAKYGARETIGLDISAEAVARAQMLADHNGLSACRFEKADAFDALYAMHKKGEQFDTVILDPPAFAKDKRALKGALRGYKEINLRGMRLTRPGGYLVSCSCSQAMRPDMFMDMLRAAALDAHRQVRVLENRGQAKDHPYLLAAPETDYLKCVLMQVL